jgi:hypothetical protein
MLKGHRFLGLRLFRFVMLWPRKVNRNRLAGFSLPHPEKSSYRNVAHYRSARMLVHPI